MKFNIRNSLGIFFLSLFLVALLSQFANAETFPYFYRTYGWESVALIAASIGFFFAAAAYMLSALFRQPQLQSWAKNEIYQSLASVFMLIFFVGVLIFFSNMAVQLTASTTVFDGQFSSAGPCYKWGDMYGSDYTICKQLDKAKETCTKASVWGDHLDCAEEILGYGREVSESQVIEVFSAYFRLAYLLNFRKMFDVATDITLNPDWPWIPDAITSIGAQWGPFVGMSMMRDIFMFLFPIGFAWIISFSAQEYMMHLIKIVFPPLLTAGLILRTLFFTRRLGGLLIAIALVLYTIWPLMYLVMAPHIFKLGDTMWVDRYNFISCSCSDKLASVILGGGALMSPAPECPARMCTRDFLWMVLEVGSGTLATAGVADLSFIPPLLRSFGAMSAYATFVPFICILVSISAIKGLSPLFGGDTEIAGLTRLI